MLTAEQKKEVFKKYSGDEKDTGSVRSQVALLTTRINDLSEHLKDNKKDHSTRRSLLKKVGQRKRLLAYMASKDITEYRKLIEELGLRK